MERKKRSKGRGWESCYVKKIYGTFGVEMRAYGQKLVKFCTHTHTHASPIVVTISMNRLQILPTPWHDSRLGLCLGFTFRVLVRVRVRVRLKLQTVFRLWLGCGLVLRT